MNSILLTPTTTYEETFISIEICIVSLLLLLKTAPAILNCHAWISSKSAQILSLNFRKFAGVQAPRTTLHYTLQEKQSNQSKDHKIQCPRSAANRENQIASYGHHNSSFGYARPKRLFWRPNRAIFHLQALHQSRKSRFFLVLANTGWQCRSTESLNFCSVHLNIIGAGIEWSLREGEKLIGAEITQEFVPGK